MFVDGGGEGEGVSLRPRRRGRWRGVVGVAGMAVVVVDVSTLVLDFLLT